MAYEAQILKDSVAEETGYRLTTIQVTVPRFVLAEYNTHRVFSRNSASSRAIPVEKQLKKVLEDPAMPVYWGKNKPGMKAHDELDKFETMEAKESWLISRDYAVLGAVALNGGIEKIKDENLAHKIADMQEDYRYNAPDINTSVHKQITNRLLEPFMWQTIITTATEWDNFFALRAHPDAQPEIQAAARLMLMAFNESEPDSVNEGQWHLPLIQDDEQEWARNNIQEAIKVSVGRCARVSYLTHDGKRDIEKDIELHDTLIEAGHMSPAEHVARPMAASYTRTHVNPFNGNFRGWMQYRKDIPHEDNYAKALLARQKLAEEGIDIDG